MPALGLRLPHRLRPIDGMTLCLGTRVNPVKTQNTSPVSHNASALTIASDLQCNRTDMCRKAAGRSDLSRIPKITWRCYFGQDPNLLAINKDQWLLLRSGARPKKYENLTS